MQDPKDSQSGKAQSKSDASVKSLEIKEVLAENDVYVQVEAVLTDLRPYIASHGGDVLLEKIENSIVYIRFKGTCVECPLSFYTVTYGIERHIKTKIPTIIRVEVLEES